MMTVRPQAHASPYHPYRSPHLFPPRASPSSYDQQQYALFNNPAIHRPTTSQPSNAYMNPILPQPPPQNPFQSPSRHGVKRSASDPDDELERSSHISTQFKKLRLNNLQQSQLDRNHDFDQSHTSITPLHAYPTNHGKSPEFLSQASRQTMPSNDFMTVDDTPHKIYILDLDSEIADIEASERSSSQLFLPDFEKQIGAIPDHVLRSNRAAYIHGDVGESSSTNSQALILYKEPSSISVPQEEDSVRKAILEARRGIREKLRREQQRDRETAHVYDVGRRRGSGLPEYRPDLLHTEPRSRYGIDTGDDNIHPPNDGDAMEIE